jgi:hypothetical protein
LAFELLPAGGDAGVADADVGEHRRFSGEWLGVFQRAGHAAIFSGNGVGLLLETSVFEGFSEGCPGPFQTRPNDLQQTLVY